ncbi:MAG: prepilin-type N-terminal cleavage/methylation domain-containing protein [Candidatus Omnitrophica bacterium]|nr:prepilin-type N-terminal cleavage/methylation domain-containing protein [Candidatus Omnitrophota bacterium]
MKKAFTLLELIVVVVIVGILATFAMPQFEITKERALDREAQGTLGLLRAAERAWFMEHNRTFYPPGGGTTSDPVAISRDLRVDLNTQNWTYTVDSGALQARARRTTGGRIRTLAIAFNGFANPGCIAGACLP